MKKYSEEYESGYKYMSNVIAHGNEYGIYETFQYAWWNVEQYGIETDFNSGVLDCYYEYVDSLEKNNNLSV